MGTNKCNLAWVYLQIYYVLEVNRYLGIYQYYDTNTSIQYQINI